MIVVHHLNNSRSQRVLWLLEELGVEYEVKRYERDPKTMLAPATLRAVHPLGKSPVITDGDLTLAESGAIVEYLVERYGAGRLIPRAGTRERLRYSYWLHYAEGSAMPPLLMKLVFTQIPRAPMPALVRPIVRWIADGVRTRFVEPQIKLHLDYLEAELKKSPVVRRGRFHGRRHPDELSRRGSGLAGWTGRESAHALGFLAADPRKTHVHSRPPKGGPLRSTQLI